MSSAFAAAPSASAATLRKISLRLLPLLGLLYVIAYIDRSNVGFAKLTLQAELGLSATVFTLGQVFFFVAYALFEVPSNLALHRYGAHRWIARIMFTWGLVTVATALVDQTWQFYLARFLLGAAEAGFFPGVLYYLTRWFPASHRSTAIGLFMLAGPLSFIIGNPLMGGLNDLHGLWGLDGWQWIFVATGLPALLMTPVVLWILPRDPETARWLAPAERSWLTGTLRAEAQQAGAQPHNPLAVLADRRVLSMALFFLCFPLATYGLAFWLPTIVEGFGEMSGLTVGLVSTIPYLCVMVGLFLVPRLAARRGSPFFWLGLMLALSVAGFLVAATASAPWLQMIGLCIASVGGYSAQPVMWSLVPRFLAGAAAAAGIAAINGIGNLGGGFGPMGIAAIVDATGSPVTGLIFLIVVSAIGLVGTLGLRRVLRVRPADTEGTGLVQADPAQTHDDAGATPFDAVRTERDRPSSKD
ncbi:MFS transporter [Actinoalloteichus hymeniacidonis]|uniref:MFS transporter n=1 Tax=Actinoalloteichus hymeniacidonis TaxID=340345 RepID=UPI000A03B0EF|nr:MFS transporter [Actinoalloteichus hymeniacidonis]MBB5908425.1 MFS family permease [Actinoalloteichus hymeniacidonis]